MTTGSNRPAVNALVVRVAIMSGVLLTVVGVVLAVVGMNQDGGTVLATAGLVAAGLGLVETLVGVTLLVVVRRAGVGTDPKPPGML